MDKRENVIVNLCILRTWCAVNPDYGMGLDVEDCGRAVGWLDDAIGMMQAEGEGETTSSVTTDAVPPGRFARPSAAPEGEGSGGVDREKVLQAMEHCDLCSDMPNCPECAYLREPGCMEMLKRDIVALLKAQEPVKPTRYQEGRWFNTWRCGACRGTLVFRNGTDKPKYCTDCGRAVKWE